MKRSICIICIAAALFSLVSCDFVSYIPPYEESLTDSGLEDVRSEYINALKKEFENCSYSADEEGEVRFLLKDASNEIRECGSIDDIIISYDKHFKLIKAVNELAYIKAHSSLYKSYLLDPFVSSIVFDDYLDEGKSQINGIIADHASLMGEAESVQRIDELFAQLKVAIYQVPTKAYLANETAKLKAQYEKLLQMHLIECATKDQRDRALEVINAYTGEALGIEYDREALTDVFLMHEAQITEIISEEVSSPSGPEIEAELLYDKLTYAIASAAFLSGSQREEWMARADTAMSEMSEKERVAEVREVYFSYMKALYEQNDLNSYISVLLNELQLYRSEQHYYGDDKSLVDTLKAEYRASVLEANDYTASSLLLDEAKGKIKEIRSIADVWEAELAAFRNKLSEQYSGGVMTEPESMMYAKNYHELADIIDYYAFYQLSGETPSFVSDRFMVELGFPHGTAEETVNVVYWYSELIKPAVGITGYFEGEDYLVIQLKPYELAIYSNRDKYPVDERLLSDVDLASDHSGMQVRDESFCDFAYLKNEKKLEGIWNTQQLFYALEHGYLPVCVPGSSAEKTLIRAEEILREIILEGMTDEEKIFRIYSWIGQNVQYDRQYYSYNKGLEDPVNYPDEKVAEMICFSAEGALLENLSVCYSFAKAYLILLRMEGIEAYLCIGRTNTETDKDETMSLTHAFVKIRLNEKWYTSDPQRSQLEVWVEGDVEMPSYLRFLMPENDLRHVVDSHKDIDMSNKGDYFIYDMLQLNGKKVFIDSVDEIPDLISYLKEGHVVQFYVKKALCADVEAMLATYPQYRSKRNKTYDYTNTEIAEYYVYE